MLQKNRTLIRTNLDMDVLRTYVCLHDLGTLQGAANSVGRSQSAVSQQLRKLEDQVGRPLFRKSGRQLALTDSGDTVLRYARRILDLNDEALIAAGGGDAEGIVRFGMPSDFAESWLPAVLGRFKRAHPKVRIEAGVDRTVALLERLDRGQLDLVLAFGASERADANILARVRLAWIGRRDSTPTLNGPVPLVAFAAPCIFRHHALEALDDAGCSWQVDFTSESLGGVWAAVAAGLGLTVRTAVSPPETLVVLDERFGLPPLPCIELCLHHGNRVASPSTAHLKSILIDTLPAVFRANHTNEDTR
jgi:DNA-binding transcriptional LysR family regulator